MILTNKGRNISILFHILNFLNPTIVRAVFYGSESEIQTNPFGNLKIFAMPEGTTTDIWIETVTSILILIVASIPLRCESGDWQLREGPRLSAKV